MYKKISIAVIISLMVAVLFYYLIQAAFATQIYLKVICHHNPANNVTLTFHTPQAYAGHLGTPHNNQVYDTNGACVAPSVTPTIVPTIAVTPTGTPSATPIPTIIEECDQDECEEPSITPTPTEEQPRVTPTSTETPVVSSSVASGISANTPSCGISDIGIVANINVLSTGNKGELEVQWSLPINADKVHIEYGLQQQAQYALLETPNDGNEVIKDLTSGSHYWFRVLGVRDCGVGQPSAWFDPIVL